MASLNKVILIGHLVADPELKQTQAGVYVCSFRIGVQRRYKNPDGTTVSDFLDIVTWRQQAEFVTKYFKKGKAICVVGSVQTRTWNDQQGNKRWSTEIIADEVSFVERSDSAGAPGGDRYSTESSYSAPPYSTAPSDSNQQGKFIDLSADDDLPF